MPSIRERVSNTVDKAMEKGGDTIDALFAQIERIGDRLLDAQEKAGDKAFDLIERIGERLEESRLVHLLEMYWGRQGIYKGNEKLLASLPLDVLSKWEATTRQRIELIKGVIELVRSRQPTGGPTDKSTEWYIEEQQASIKGVEEDLRLLAEAIGRQAEKSQVK